MSAVACPDCAESIDAADVACRFCGAGLRSVAPPGFANGPVPRRVPADPDLVTTPISPAASAIGMGPIIALLGAVTVVAGSLGPWVDTVLGSVSGTRGDGRISLAAAVIAAVFTLLLANGSGGLVSATCAALCGIAAGAVGVVDLGNVKDKVDGATLFGHQIATVGWGLYAVIAGACLIVVGVFATAKAPHPRQKASA